MKPDSEDDIMEEISMKENQLILPDGSLTLLAARPGMGQGALAITIAQKLQKRYPKRQVLYFSLEMPRKYLYCCYKIPADSKLCVIDHLFNLEDICSTAQLIQKCGQLGLIVVDYLQLLGCFDSELMKSKHDSYEIHKLKCIRTMNYNLEHLKRLAVNLHVPVLVTAHLTRNIDNRADKHPVIKDLRSAKIIEQDPDQIWLLYCDSYYNSEADERKSELIIAKNRYGDLGTMQLSCEKMGVCSWFSGLTVSYDNIFEKGGTENENKD